MFFKKIIFIVGPTAAGKTEVACFLAKAINGEIISCDAMQVYREVSIANNKPPKAAFQSIPHHLIGVVSIAEDFDVAIFRKKALATIAAIQRKKKIPIIVGGSGLYMKVLLDGIFEGKRKNARLRARLEKEAETKGSTFLHERLQKLDPEAAKKIHPNDMRRIIRALEVCLTTKNPISRLQKNRQGLWGKFDVRIFALNRDRPKLYEMINQRVDKMFLRGIIGEIEGLLKKKWSKTAQSIIGVREVTDYLQGSHNLEQTKYLMKLKTRRYAKRQLTWFRREKRLSWLTIGENDTPKTIVEEIMRKVRD